MSPTASRRFVPDNSPGALLGLLAVVLALLPGTARAEADVFGLGNGQHGSLQVRDPGLVINASTALSAEAPAGTTELAVEDALAFKAGELVLVLQVGGELPLSAYRPAGDTLDLRDSGAGRWELARLSGVASGVLRLTAPLVNRFPLVSQVVRVPEYTNVHILSTGSLKAPPWNGRSGGVLALLATGTLFNQGTLDADGAGFPGGVAETGVAQSLFDCAQQDGPASSGGGARKGEGLASMLSGAPSHGYGRLANGGGGGNCHDSGGGGGGHIGKGGQGGRSSQESSERDVGGRGGTALRYPPLERLLFGGGGGAGIEGTAGGAGGGVVFVRALEVQGPRLRGTLTANGLEAVASQLGGGGGGGAGGTVHVRVAERFGCFLLRAGGGAGGDSNSSPGGGGGGGLLFIQAPSGVPSDCGTSVASGLAGSTSTGSTRGAEPVASGAAGFDGNLTVINQAFAVPPVPTWLSPGAGEEGVAPLPRLEGKTAPGATVQVFLDGAALGAPVVADGSGAFAVVPSAELADGPHEARAWAEQLGARSALSEPLGFTVGEAGEGGEGGEGGEAFDLRVGFGCGVASGSGAWALGLVVLAAVRGRRFRSPKLLGARRSRGARS